MIELPVTLTSTGGAVSFASPVTLGYTKNKGVYRLLVTAEGEWEGLTIRCFWHLPGGTDPASSLVQDGFVDVPASVTAQPGTGCITFEGSDGEKTVTSADLRYKVGSNSGTEDGTMPEPGAPAWEQLVSATKANADAAEQAKQDAEAAAKEAENAATKAKEAASAAAKSAQKAEAAQKATEQAEAAAAESIAGAKKEALSAISAGEQGALGAVQQAQATATGAVQAAQTAAESAVSTAKTNAVQEVEAAAKPAQTAAAKAEEAAERSTQAGIAASNAADDAKRSAGIATGAADDSALNAENAQKSALSAQQSAENAAASQSAAQASADAAEKSQQSAATDAKTANDSKVAAAGSADAAAGSAVAAENSASAAAGSEQAAGASEVKAAESEKAAKASEQAAAKSAQAALESKTAAATSEGNAAASAKKAQDVADSLPVDYTTAVNEIAALKTNKADKTELETVKQQVANITPDDSSIGDKPWSSKNIVDTLCPPLEESGNPVVCYPVENYPLGVTVSWEPTQEGSGTPSMDNIRPITGRDSVSVDRCGENLLPFGERIEDIYQQQIMSSDALLLLSKACAGQKLTLTFSVETQNIVFNDDVEDEWRKRIGFECHGTLADGTEVYALQCWINDENGELTKNGKKTKTVTEAMPAIVSGDITFYAQNITSGSFVAYDFGIYAGTTAPTTHTPYTGQTNTLTLPTAIYGGEVDAVMGDGKRTWEIIDNYAGETIPGEWISDRDVYSADKNPTVGAQVAYRLAEPVSFTATGAQPIPALAGTNTVLTDADSVTVTGRADPIKRITDLEDKERKNDV